MNTGVHVSFQISVFAFFKYIPRSGIAGSYGSSIFSFLRNFHIVLHSGCASLHPHQPGRRVPFSPHLSAFVFHDIYLWLSLDGSSWVSGAILPTSAKSCTCLSASCPGRWPLARVWWCSRQAQLPGLQLGQLGALCTLQNLPMGLGWSHPARNFRNGTSARVLLFFFHSLCSLIGFSGTLPS